MDTNLQNILIEPQDDFCFETVLFEDNPIVSNNDIDPDLNYFNSSCHVLSKCKYHQEDSFSDLLNVQNDYEEGVSLLHLNIRSCQKDFDDFETYIHNLNHNFSVIGLSETWLNDSVKDLYSLPGYNSLHLCRNGKKGGGVSLYVHESLDCYQRLDMTVINESMECLFVEINAKKLGMNEKVIVGVIYRPPNSDIGVFNNLFSNVLELIKDNNVCYCMGDYNINLLKNEIHKETGQFLDMMYANSFVPLINRPTRITEFSSTIIDNIFCNNLDVYREQIPGILYTDLSDHFPVFVLNFHAGNSTVT